MIAPLDIALPNRPKQIKSPTLIAPTKLIIEGKNQKMKIPIKASGMNFSSIVNSKIVGKRIVSSAKEPRTATPLKKKVPEGQRSASLIKSKTDSNNKLNIMQSSRSVPRKTSQTPKKPQTVLPIKKSLLKYNTFVKLLLPVLKRLIIRKLASCFYKIEKSRRKKFNIGTAYSKTFSQRKQGAFDNDNDTNSECSKTFIKFTSNSHTPVPSETSEQYNLIRFQELLRESNFVDQLAVKASHFYRSKCKR